MNEKKSNEKKGFIFDCINDSKKRTSLLILTFFVPFLIIYSVAMGFYYHNNHNIIFTLDENTTTFMGATILTSLATSITTFIFLYETNQNLKKKEGYYTIVIEKYQTNVKKLLIEILFWTSFFILFALIICIISLSSLEPIWIARITGLWCAFVTAALFMLLFLNIITQYAIIKFTIMISKFAKLDYEELVKPDDKESNTVIHKCSKLLQYRHLMEGIVRKSPTEKRDAIEPEHIYDAFEDTENKLESLLEKLKTNADDENWQKFIMETLEKKIDSSKILDLLDDNLEHYWIMKYCLLYSHCINCSNNDNKNAFINTLSKKYSRMIKIGERYDTYMKFLIASDEDVYIEEDVEYPECIDAGLLLLTAMINQTIDDIDLSKIDLSYMSFYGSDLTNVDLTSAIIKCCDFTEAKLCNAKLGEIVVCDDACNNADDRPSGVIFKSVDFSNATFGKIDFDKKVNLENSKFSNSIIKNARFQESNMNSVGMLDMNINKSTFVDVPLDCSRFVNSILDYNFFQSKMEDVFVIIRDPKNKEYKTKPEDKIFKENCRITISVSGVVKFDKCGNICIIAPKINANTNRPETYNIKDPFSSFFRFVINVENTKNINFLECIIDDKKIELKFTDKGKKTDVHDCFISPLTSRGIDWNTVAGKDGLAIKSEEKIKLNQNKGCDFEGSFFGNSFITNSLIHWANMRNMYFVDSQIFACDVSGTWFSETEFRNAVIGNTTTVLSTFVNCNFNRCVFENTTINNIRFVHCNFNNTKFTNSKIISAAFEECSFSDALVENSYFNNVRINKIVQFSERDYDNDGNLINNNSPIGDWDFFLDPDFAKSTEIKYTAYIEKSTFVDTKFDGDDAKIICNKTSNLGNILKKNKCI